MRRSRWVRTWHTRLRNKYGAEVHTRDLLLRFVIAIGEHLQRSDAKQPSLYFPAGFSYPVWSHGGHGYSCTFFS